MALNGIADTLYGNGREGMRSMLENFIARSDERAKQREKQEREEKEERERLDRKRQNFYKLVIGVITVLFLGLELANNLWGPYIRKSLHMPDASKTETAPQSLLRHPFQLSDQPYRVE